MRTVGIKLADGSFYPIMEEGSAQTKKLELTTANDNQTCVMVDLYRSKTCSMEDAEYIDTLKIENLNAHQNGEPSISFDVGLDENGELSASIADPETGATRNSQLTLVSRTAEERLVTDDFAVEENDSGNGAAVAAGVVAGAGLLAAAGIMAANKNDDEPVAEEPIDEPVADEGLASFDEAIEDETFVDEPAVEETIADDTILEEPVADETVSDDTIAEDTILDEPVSDDTISEEPVFDEPVAEEPAADDTIADDTISEEALPDMDFDMGDDTTIADDTTFADDSTIPGDETTLEDDSFTAPTELTDFDEEDSNDFFNSDSDIDSDPTPAPAQELNFSGLYDKETEMGESSVHEEDDIKKKTRAPVIICVVCAIICIVATILVLLVVPGKFNLRQKFADKKSQTAVEKQAEAPAKPVAEEKKPEPVPQAKEDEVVVIEKAEEVKPVPPPAAETKKSDVSYKIKWGDTLWDIADTYYKNPWRYKKIASYNNIKNPDHIISGTIIQIPAE